MAYGVAGLGRFRVNVFQQRGNLGLVLRVVPTKIRTTEELNMPRIVGLICNERRGLVLVTGTTGSGKSTTLASMIDRINSSRTDHIITIEDPIEYLHRDKKGFVNQREVEVDTHNFSAALRAALRQDPDVILVGEMRDLETIGTALLAAETGHLVFSTLHTLDAAETIQRIIAVFPPPEQKQIRLQLASTLKAVISQRLVRKADDIGRVPAVEVLITTAFVRDCLVNPDKTRMIREAISTGTSQYGMQTFDQSLYDLYTQGLVTYEECLAQASNPDEFKLRVQGISSTADVARDQMQAAIGGADYQR
jgi:twitching motility protein PilT